MLKIIRRVFDFSDWRRSHPKDPPPGDMLDAQFDTIIDTVDVWDAKIRGIVDDNGKVGPGKVGLSALDSDFRAFLADKLDESVQKLRFELSEYAKSAISAEKTTLAASLDAIRAAAAAKIAESAVSAAQNRAEAQFAAVEARAAEMSAAASAALLSQASVTAGEGEAEAWAVASALWAEHMPDTIPDNAVKVMDITGDHWSSRWWANQAANAFGMLTSLYLGAHPEPPLTNNNGGPIQIGSIYFDTEPPPGQTMVWNGSQWVSMTQPARAMVSTLWYSATAGQTAFPLTAADLYGHSYTISSTAPEPIGVWVNGVKLMPYQSPLGDWTIAASTVTMQRPLRAGDLVSFDIYMPNEALGPGAVHAWSIAPLTGKDGVRTAFTLSTKESPGVPVTVVEHEELVVSLDGVIQEPGVSFTASGATITFTQAPAADAYIFITWFRPN